MKYFINGIIFITGLSSAVLAKDEQFSRTRLEMRILFGAENIVIADIAGPMKRMLEVEDAVLAYENEARKDKKLKLVWEAYQGSFSKVYYNSRVNDYRLQPDQKDFTIFVRSARSPGKDIRLGDKLTGSGFVVIEYDINIGGFRVLSRPGPEKEARIKKIIEERVKIEKQLLEIFYAE